ncbi:MAG: glycoside hydrolase family 43 protein, partial [Lachnospiraceae bacterium]|nr:glycoside hydrolase family 43 protein [Lachnospiraceae bacterium]
IYTSYQNNVSSTLGMRLMSYYKWSYQTYAQVAQGHNSVYYDQDTDQVYLVYHTRTNDGTEGHSVRVHQLFVNEDGWLVTAPFEYAGETTTNAELETTSYDTDEIVGMYEVLLQAQSIDYANLAYVEPVYIALGSDGTISGDLSGTWAVTDGTCYITLTTGTDTYKGVLLTQTVEGKTTKTVTFTGVGTSTETAIWGYQFSGTEALTMEAEALTLPAQTVNGTALDLPTAGTYGTTITWKSSDASIIATDGTVTVPDTTTTVTLTAVISNDAGSVTETYDVTVIGEDATAEDGSITIWSADETFDLTDAVQGTYQYVNFFNSEIGTAGLDLDNGVSIEFTVSQTGDYAYLSNILGINAGSTGGLYFTGGSYLGYNAGEGYYFDANVDSTNWVAGTDYISGADSVTFRIEIYSYKYEVYVDDELAFSNTTVDAGTTSGTNSMDSYNRVLTYLNSTATEFDLGWGSWWEGGFAGTISNITLSVLGDEDVDTCGYTYYADYAGGGGTTSDWTAQDSGYLAIANDGDTRGNYVKYAYNTSVSGARYAYTKFSEDAQLSGQYTVSVDVQLTAGQSGSSTTSNFAIMGTDASGYTSHTTGGISSGYILKLSNNYPADSSTVWTINDDSDTTVTIPAATWVTITADVDTDAGTAAVTIIGEDDTVYFSGTVSISGTGTLAGICVLRGRGYGTVSIDNIKVYQTPTVEFLGGSLRIDTTDYDTTSLRFGYTIDLGSVDLSSIDLEDEHATEWSWEWSVDGASNGGTVEGVNYVDNGDGTITTNLVITGIPSEYYTSDLYSTLTLTYCLGGETQTIVLEDSPQVRSVYEVATAITEDSTASETAAAYAEAILEVISAE